MSSVVPEGWSRHKLGDSLSTRPKSKLPSGESNPLGYYDFYICSHKVMKSFHNEYSSPSILFSTGGEASVHFATERYAFSTDVWATEFEGNICNEYAFHLLKDNIRIINYLGFQGSGIKHLDKSFIEKLEFSIPPLPEQKKIASILTSVDEVIENTQKQIDKLQDLKKATMNELLTKGIGHTEFKDSELGRIPKSWEVVELNDLVGSLSGGVSVNSENRNRVGSELGVLKTSCVSNGKFFPNEHKAVISEDVHRVRTPVEAETILFSRMNTPDLVGESCYVEQSFDNLYLPDRLWALKLRDKSKTSVRWLSWLLVSTSVKSVISNAATGTSGSMKNISKPNLLAIKVRYPPVNEQFQIASVINSLEYKRVSTQTKMNTLVSLKKSLMQDLLTGKVRVTVN